MLMLGLKFFAAKIMGKLHFKILQHTLIPKFWTVKLSDKYRVQKFYRPKFIESENFIALYYIEILQSISLDSIIYSTSLLSGTPEPGGLGAVAPHFFASSTWCQDRDMPSKESVISIIYVKSLLVLSLVKLYPIRNVILKLFHESEKISKFIKSGNKGSSEVLSNAMGTAKEIATFIECSPKFESIIRELKENVDGEDQERSQRL